MRKRTTEKRWEKPWRVCSGGEWLNMVRMAVNTQINIYMYNRAALLPFVTARLFPLTTFLRVKIWTPRSLQGADVQQFLQFYIVYIHTLQAMCVYERNSSIILLVLAERMSYWPDVGLRLSTCLMLLGNQYSILLLQVELHKYVPSRKFNAINTDFGKTTSRIPGEF